MQKTTVYGLPLNPTHLLEQLKGGSFCVSYATRDKLGKQLEQAIRLVGEDGVLLVDNGAFSHFMSGGAMTEEYIEGYEAWAADILERCPQAIAVIPDVIGGTVEQNSELINTTMLDTDRAMPIWHLGEPLSFLRHLLDGGFNYIGFGSSGEYCGKGVVGSDKWHARIKEAMDMIDAWEIEGNECRPRIHMMLAQSQAHLHRFDSSDSTNVARNHNRHRKTYGLTENHVADMAARVDGKIQATAGPAAAHQVKRPLLAHVGQVDILQKYWLMDRGFSEEGALEFMASCAGDLNVDVDEDADEDEELLEAA